MSLYNDYTKFGKHNKFRNENNKKEEKTELVEENTDTIVEEILEENNIEFEELSKEEVNELKEDEIMDINLNSLNENNLKLIPQLGEVFNCEKLNVREQPNKNSKPIEILQKDDIVEIDTNKSTDEFYKVWTKSGKSGYCMKKFIKID